MRTLTTVWGMWRHVVDASQVVAGTPRIVGLVWRAHPWYALGALLLNAAQGVSPMLHAWLAKLVLDAIAAAVSGAGEPAAAVPYILALAAARALYSLGDASLRAPAHLVWQQLADYVTRDVQALLLRKATSRRDIAFFESPRYYDLLERARNDAGFRPINLVNTLLAIFRTVLGLLAAGGVLFALQPLLPALLVACSLPQFVVQFRQGREVWALNDSSIPEVRWMGYVRRVLTERAEAKEVRLFGLGGYFLGEHQRAFESYRARYAAQRVRHWRWNTALAALGGVAGAAGYGYIVVLALSGRSSVDDIVLYTAALAAVQGATEGLVSQLASVYEGNLFARNVFACLDLAPALPERRAPEARRVAVPLRAGIELRGVGFTYAGTERPVLHDVSFAIRPGQSVALVGENGAGKTTLVKLLTRLYDPTAGRILVDGVDLREHDLDDWRRQIAVVFQDFMRYALVARENIGVGNVPLIEDLAAVRAAARRGGAHEVVARLPDRYEAMLGRRFKGSGSDGVDLSGGEWQKVALSRAFMRVPLTPGPSSTGGRGEPGVTAGASRPARPADGPPLGAALSRDGSGARGEGAQLLILDEPTAALDARAEHELYLRFRELTRGRSTLLISHRFSTVRMADHIVVLDGGRIAEEGTHAELLALGGTYADLYEKQAARYR
ncbi:MAG: ABC transporter ATP-binding protein [Chloroflexi bacterium]|nr:ABC transporter ATP-binding protein [Chloroflexota bacterium]